MLSLLEEYDIYLVDAYGVFWDGAQFIAGTKETLKHLVQRGKTVIILSNATQRSANAIEKYAALGLFQGEHYHALVTSGEVARKMLEEGWELQGKKLSNYYNFGTPNNALFEGLPYASHPLEQAEFIYIGIPQFSDNEKALLDGNYAFYASCQSLCWDTTDLEAFSPRLHKLIQSGLPVLSANPDLVAPEKCKITRETHSVIRQGTIANALAAEGLEVRQVGKPYAEIYAFCRTLLREKLGFSPVQLERAKAVMIGDTVETDICGAHNATVTLHWPVASILTLTGNAARIADNEGVSIKEQCQRVGCAPAHIITSFGIEGRVL